MEMDLNETAYDQRKYEDYILGSAEVVGLMCLKIFTNNDEESYNHLKPTAMKLGAAFQKVNFLRDLKADFKDLGRSYFPGIDMNNFSSNDKIKIENEIEINFKKSLVGIKKLPPNSKLGVYLAYVYYIKLFKKIKQTTVDQILENRIRVSNFRKITLLCSIYLKYHLKLL